MSGCQESLMCEDVPAVNPIILTSQEREKRKRDWPPCKTNDLFLQQISEKYGDEFVVLSKYTRDTGKVKVRHTPCGSEYEIGAGVLLQHSQCRVCANKRMRKRFVRTHEEFIGLLKQINGDEYTVIGKYVNALTPITVKHNLCGSIYKTRPNSLLRGNGCQRCAWDGMKSKNPNNRRISRNIKTGIIHRLMGRKKSSHTLKLLGCSIVELRAYLEEMFVSGMSWDNYGKWQIDHIRPCASFDLSEPEQQMECFNFKNLQPLWAVDNRKKHSWWNGVHYKGDIDVRKPAATTL